MLKAKEIPMHDVRRTEVPAPESITSGLDAVVDGWIGKWHSRRVHSTRLWETAGQCQEQYVSTIRDLHENALRSQLHEAHRRVRRLGNRWADEFDQQLPIVVGAARKALGIEPYRTQIMGALALSKGSLTEMATGEGKTLTIALAAAIAGWSGRPVHIITANDYLASRDAINLGNFYELCGLSVASVTADMNPQQRRSAYQASVVYCTGKELVADFLRDRILLGDLAQPARRSVERLKGELHHTHSVLRGLHVAFVDEADNQLIDEAVTPLIISRREEDSSIDEAMTGADQLAASMLPGEDYELNERQREISLLPAGREKIAAWSAERQGLLSAPDWMGDLAIAALQARHFFLEGKQYVIIDDKIVIVDEFTGRQMPGRSWRLGLHQAVEAKEALEISTPSETLARLSFQRFYRLFRHLAGISGTAREAASEFWRVYRLPLIEVPRHKPNQRNDFRPKVFLHEGDKRDALVQEVLEMRQQGRPVLVGSRSVTASEQLAQRLQHVGVDCSVLNAARHDDEAQIIAMAGGDARVTIATNMAGRGTDILIGKSVVKAGGLHVILSEPHESARVDRQLMGRSGRQGDPGSSSVYTSLEDEISERYLPKPLRKIAYFLRSVNIFGANSLTLCIIRFGQRRAELQSLRRRLLVLKQDFEMSKRLMNSSIDRI